MFTGIIRDKGTVTKIERHSETSLSLWIESSLPEREFENGASVACNGVCLTVCEASSVGDRIQFKVDLGPQTLAATRFSSIQPQTKIHLEPALRVGDAVGGHNVTGHVDGTVRVVDSILSADGFCKLVLDIPSLWAPYMIAKGSVAIAGTSLTIAQVRPHDEKPKAVFIEIMLIPHTLSETCLGDLQAGDVVEIECDQMTKMVASVVTRMLNMRQ